MSKCADCDCSQRIEKLERAAEALRQIRYTIIEYGKGDEPLLKVMAGFVGSMVWGRAVEEADAALAALEPSDG